MTDRYRVGRVQSLVLDGTLPGLNDLIDAAKRRFGRGRSRQTDQYTKMKRYWTQVISRSCLAQGLKPVNPPVYVRFLWRERTRRRDPDNVAGAGQKLVLDGLVAAGILPDDGWRSVAGLDHTWAVSETPGVDVTIVEIEEVIDGTAEARDAE